MGLTERSPLKKVEALRESVAVVVKEAQAEKRIVDAQVPTKKEVALVPTRNAARAATGALMLKKEKKGSRSRDRKPSRSKDKKDEVKKDRSKSRDKKDRSKSRDKKDRSKSRDRKENSKKARSKSRDKKEDSKKAR